MPDNDLLEQVSKPRTKTGDSGFPCPLCHKTYSRSDVLSRHLVQAHGQRAKRAGRPRQHRQHTRSSVIRAESGHSSADAASPAGDDAQQNGEDASPDNNNSNSNSNINDKNNNAGPGPARLEWELLSGELSHQQSFEASGIDMGDHTLPGIFFDSADPWASQPVAAFDWGFTDVDDTDIFEAIGAHPQHSLEANDHAHAGFLVPDRDSEIVKALKAEEVDGQPNTGDLPNGSPEASSWDEPTVYHPNTPVDPIDLPRTRPGTPTMATINDAPTASVNAQARQSMQILAEYAHRSVWPLPDLTTFPSTQSLTACVNLYLAHFASWLPIVDSPRRSFRVDKAAPILLMAMASIGSVYGNSGMAKLAFPLDELVRRQIMYICEHDHRFVLEPCVMQASLLQSYFGLYSGSPRLFHHTEISRASLVTACRRMHLLHADYSATKELRRRDPSASLEEIRKAMRQDHRYSRLGWAIFLFDSQLFCFFGTPCHYALYDIQVSLPVAMPDIPGDRATFGQLMAGLLDRGQLLEEPSDMGLSCLAYALYRLCLESAPASQRSFSQLSSVSQYPHPPQKLLDQLARHVTDSPASLTALRLSCVALAHHSYLELTDFGLLGKIKVAAGRAGVLEQHAAQRDVELRLRGNPSGARCMFAHAAMLRCLLNRFTFDTPTEVIWTFDAALAMWAFLQFSGLSLDEPGEPGEPMASVQHALTWTPSPQLDDWVRWGKGRVSVQGIGSGGDINAAAVLRGASERLEVMSWGLAFKYRVVLNDLLAQS